MRTPFPSRDREGVGVFFRLSGGQIRQQNTPTPSRSRLGKNQHIADVAQAILATIKLYVSRIEVLP